MSNTSSTHITLQAPQGMSHVNALFALWHGSTPASCLQSQPILQLTQSLPFSLPQTVNDLFKKLPLPYNPFQFDYVAGRLIKADFSNFPTITISRQYNEQAGEGAALRALTAYNNIPSNDRLDAGDLYRFEDLTSQSTTSSSTNITSSPSIFTEIALAALELGLLSLLS